MANDYMYISYTLQHLISLIKKKINDQKLNSNLNRYSTNIDEYAKNPRFRLVTWGYQLYTFLSPRKL